MDVVRESRELKLTQGVVALIDAEDFDRLNAWPWYPATKKKANRTYVYPYTHWRIPGSGDPGKYVSLMMHQMLMMIPRGMRGDHINGDTLDNRKQNLRIVTHSQNLWNMGARDGKRFKGIDYREQKGKWRARIMIDRQVTFLGYFDTDEEAARAYDEAAKRFQGEYARLNFPNG